MTGGPGDEIVKAIAPEAYRDVVQPAAREVGKTLGGAVRVALSPVNLAVWTFDRACEWAQEAVAKRLADVPPDRIAPPPPVIAGPALEALRLAGPDPDLRELYANLLATAIDAATIHRAHPAFVEILRQLAPDEARLIAHLGKHGSRNVAGYFEQPKNSGPFTVMQRRPARKELRRQMPRICKTAGCTVPENGAAYVDNVTRLGLAQIVESTRGASSVFGKRISFDLTITAFGMQFWRACVASDQHSASSNAAPQAPLE